MEKRVLGSNEFLTGLYEGKIYHSGSRDERTTGLFGHICFFGEDINEEIKISKRTLDDRVMYFHDLKFSENLIIENSTYDGLKIEGGCYKSIKIRNCTIKFIEIISAEGKSISLQNCRIKEKIIISDTSNDSRLGFNEIRIECESPDVNISSINVENLHFENCRYNQGSNISISNLQPKRFEFRNFYNHGTMDILNLSSSEKEGIENYFIIQNSNLGATSFVSCGFEIFTMIVDNSNLTKLFYTNTRFPKIIESLKENKYNNLWQQYDTYSQLNGVSSRLGHTVNALYWKSKALQSYQRTRNWLSTSQLWDKLLLFLLEKTSSYGQNWIRSLCSIMLFSILMYSFMVPFAETDVEWCITCFDQWFNVVQEYSSKIFIFMIPTHSFNFLGRELEDIDNLFGYLLIDVFSRVVLGFMIYNFIRSARKYFVN